MFSSQIFSTVIFGTLFSINPLNQNQNVQLPGCIFQYETDFPTVPSLLLTDATTLLEPKYDPLRLNFQQQVIVACPGSNNVIEKLNTPHVVASCACGKTLRISSRFYELNELGCIRKVQPECEITMNSCGNKLTGNLVNIGYKISNTILTLFQICYDYNTKVPLYAQHNIYGSTISHAKGSNNRPVFKAGCLPSSFTQKELYDAYTQSAQLKKFEEILGSKELAEYYITIHQSYLAKGHLNADGDQVLNTSTTATYLYMNTVPMWQQLNNGNWKSLEIAIRKYAKDTGEKLKILTGGHDILKLPDRSGVEKNIFLAGSSNIAVAVPKYIWKIFYSKQTNSGMGFIALNNPFYTGSTMNICQNICDTYKWGTNLWRDPKRGLLYCCSIEELAQIIPQIPNDFFSN